MGGDNDLVLPAHLPSLHDSSGVTGSSVDKRNSSSNFLMGRGHTRASSMSGDFGVVGVSSGTAVSRYACRIECEREPPHRCFLYAAGYDANNVIYS